MRQACFSIYDTFVHLAVICVAGGMESVMIDKNCKIPNSPREYKSSNTDVILKS